MLYIIRTEVDPMTGVEIEGNPKDIEDMVGMWQKLNPVGMYFSMTEREMTVIVDVPNEDAFFEALHKTWVVAKTYPKVSPVADGSQFQSLLQRVLPH